MGLNGQVLSVQQSAFSFIPWMCPLGTVHPGNVTFRLRELYRKGAGRHAKRGRCVAGSGSTRCWGPTNWFRVVSWQPPWLLPSRMTQAHESTGTTFLDDLAGFGHFGWFLSRLVKSDDSSGASLDNSLHASFTLPAIVISSSIPWCQLGASATVPSAV